MKKSTKLRQERQVQIDAQTAILEAATDDNGVERALTADENTKFDAAQTRIDALKVEITRAEKYEDSLAEASRVAGTPVATPEKKEKEKIESRFDVKKMMGIVVERNAMDGAEKEVNEIALEELRNSGVQNISTKGFNIPASMAFRGAVKEVKRADAQTVTEDGGNFGGTLVNEEAGILLPSFVDNLAIEDLGVQTHYDVVGDFPLHSVNEFAFENVTETQGLTAQKAGTSKRVLKPKRTGLMAYVSNQLFAQTAGNIFGILSKRITGALNRRLFLDMINGDGVAPNCLGLLNDALAFDFGGAAGPLTLAKVLELEGEVDEEEATEIARQFLVHTKVARIAKGIPIDAGSGRFLMDINNSLYGSKTTKTSLIPALNGGTEYPTIYGDFGSIEAAFWGGMNLKADETTRADSNEIRLIVNVHRDIMASNPKAFAANKKVTIA